MYVFQEPTWIMRSSIQCHCLGSGLRIANLRNMRAASRARGSWVGAVIVTDDSSFDFTKVLRCLRVL